MSIIDNATTKDVQNVINGVTPPTYSNEAGKTTSAISITVNGSTRTFNGSAAVNLGSIYAPTSAGSSGQVLKSNGSGAPTFKDLFTVSSATYTRGSVTGGTTIRLSAGETGERSLKIISFTARESAETGYFEVRTSRGMSDNSNKLGAVGGQDGYWGAQNLSLTVCVPPDSECYLVNCWNLETINYTVTTISW